MIENEKLSLEYRHALSNFSTGITLVTSIDDNSVPFAITINSFSSISLNPKIISWSLGLSNKYINCIKNNNFIIQILDGSSKDIAIHFSKTINSQNFTAYNFELKSNLPVLKNCLSWFECKNFNNLIVGDHAIILGEVISFSDNTKKDILHKNALTFFRRGISSIDFY